MFWERVFLKDWEKLSSVLFGEAAAALLSQNLLGVWDHEVVGLIRLHVKLSVYPLVLNLVFGHLNANLGFAEVCEAMLGAVVSQDTLQHP
jgi:hypothetical protein